VDPVVTLEQIPASQLDLLHGAGCQKVFVDHAAAPPPTDRS